MKNFKILLLTVCAVSFFDNCMSMKNGDGKSESKGVITSNAIKRDDPRLENQKETQTKNLYTGIRAGSGKAVQRALAEGAVVNIDDFDKELAASEKLSPMGLAMLRLFEEPDNFVAQFVIIQHIGEHPDFDHEHLEKMGDTEKKLPNTGNNNRALAYLHRALEWGNYFTKLDTNATSLAKHFAVAKFFLKRDSKAEVTDEDGQTAAQFCIEFGLEHAINFLIEHDIDMFSTPDDRDTCYLIQPVSPYTMAQQKLALYVKQKDAEKVTLYTRIVGMLEASLEVPEEEEESPQQPVTRGMAPGMRSARSDASGITTCLCAVLRVMCVRHPWFLRCLDCCCSSKRSK